MWYFQESPLETLCGRNNILLDATHVSGEGGVPDKPVAKSARLKQVEICCSEYCGHCIQARCVDR